MSRRMKRGTRRWITIIAVVLVSVTLCGILGNVTNGFEYLFEPTEWVFRKVNEDNLYQQVTFLDTDGILADGEKGVTVRLTDDNAIKVNGYTDETLAISVGTIALKAGKTYVFDGDVDGGSKKTMYMSLNGTNGTTEKAKSFDAAVTYTPEEDITVTLVLNIAAEASVDNAKLHPVICIADSVDEAVSFYK